MTRLLVAAFLIAHGLIHLAIYATPHKPDEKAPFDPGHSWVLTGMRVATHPARVTAVALSTVSAALYSMAGLAVLLDAGWWTAAAAGAAVVGLVLKIAYFHPWLTLGVLLDAGVLWAVSAGWPPSLM